MIEVYSADVIATLLLLKAEVEAQTGTKIQMTLSGATEAHLLAKEIGEAGVGVVFVSSRPFPTTWEQRRLYVLRSCSRCSVRLNDISMALCAIDFRVRL